TRLKVPNFCEGTLRLSIGAPREVLRTVTPCDCHWRPLETSPASPARGRHRPARAAATGKPARVEATIPTHGTEGPGQPSRHVEARPGRFFCGTDDFFKQPGSKRQYRRKTA